MIIGIIGLIFIAIGWVPQVIEIIKTKKNKMNIGFSLFYTLGSLALVIYAVQIYDLVFIILNGAAFLMSSVGLTYALKSKIKN